MVEGVLVMCMNMCGRILDQLKFMSGHESGTQERRVEGNSMECNKTFALCMTKHLSVSGFPFEMRSLDLTEFPCLVVSLLSSFRDTLEITGKHNQEHEGQGDVSSHDDSSCL